MDSKDSSSNSIVAASSAAAEDDGVLSATAGLAKDASVAFHSGKFLECVDLLNQLLQIKDDDPKILHNIAIARYFQHGCSDPKKLLEVLNNVKKRSDELADASSENADAVGNLGNKTALGSKGTNSVAHQFSSANSSHVYGDEFDTSVTMLNIAVIWFHLHEYAKAYSILDSLYQKIEPIDEATALHICLLFLDAALASHDPWKFVDVINYVEKAYCFSNLISQNDNGSSTTQQSSNLVVKSSSLPSNSNATDVSNSDSVANSNSSESPLSRTLSEENLESLISSIDMSGQNLARPSGVSTNDLSRTPADHSISTSDLRLKLQLYKVRLLLLTRNLKAAKREVKMAMAMNVARGKDSSMALLLKSQLEYARGNYRKAIKLLMASSNRTEMGISSIYNNNLGCIYYRLGKYHTSTIFFSKALSNSSSLRKEKPLKLSTFSQDKSLQIIYNCGVQYLACGKPILAARCFHKASLIFYNRPLLWFRIAECCLMALEKGLLKSGPAQLNGSDVKVHVVGMGKWRQLAVEDGVSRNGKVDFVGTDDCFLGDDKQPNLSLSLARQCLFNALYLLNRSESKCSNSDSPHGSTLEENESGEVTSSNNTNYRSGSGGDPKASNLMVGTGQINGTGDAKEQKGGNGNSPNAALQSSISDYEEICERENLMIKQALLADLAYVELELGNPLKALSTARCLLELPECSRIYIFLGNVYAAESLCLLNRPKEAAEQLLIYLSGDNNVELPYSKEDCEQWQVIKNLDCEESNGGFSKNSSLDESQDVMFLNPVEARGTLYANQAAIFALQGELEQAHRSVFQALLSIPDSPEAIVTAIYVDLMIGKTQEALAKLKQCSRVRFLLGSSMLKNAC
ncbi:CCR4-NOT transcription complex subunit 10 [Camellia lanceoleosa]|uniref:CCR4-NOT transcription complex subunit 10 n=1 Tax=Camellia lanceoleosa TaxID=1840588 RepID=A0ACC0I8Z5_9ERIC|nr:CCR4-NOT transcription complex subunit 10 [Camellia lanceoleosa]